MKREIKFRAWDIYENKFINDIYITENGEMFTFNEYDIAIYRRHEDIILMQYTGLKDKNGVLIFEGDVVQSDKFNYFVVFENGSFVLYHTLLKNFDGSKYRWGLLSRVYELHNFNIQVIGNIYENKELI